MMFGTLVDPQHHATAQQSSGCPLQPSAERQNSGEWGGASRILAFCGGLQRATTRLLGGRMMLRIDQFHIVLQYNGASYGVH
jgi:hypothetical protein